MIFHQFRAGGCLSYLLACERSHSLHSSTPRFSLLERYLGEASSAGLRLKYVIDTHTHADHFSATHACRARLALPAVMHRATEAAHVDLRVEDGEELLVGDLRLEVIHTPGHTTDSMCLLASDRVLTGDTLLIGATGRTDLPAGDPPQCTRACSAAAQASTTHCWCSRPTTTRAVPRRPSRERATNPRLQLRDPAAFVAQMRSLSLAMPTHLTEALRTNRSGGQVGRPDD